MDPFSSAAIGAVAGKLLEVILAARELSANFPSHFDRLQATLAAVVTQADEIQRINDELGRSRDEIKGLVTQLDGGKLLVEKCTAVPRWDYYKRYRYSKKILKLDESIKRFFDFELRVTEARDVKEILKEVLSQGRKLDRLSGRSGGLGPDGWCTAAPELPSLTVGMDVPVRGVKARLLAEGVSVLVLSGQGGSGKTTLASKLCLEPDIKGVFKENIYFAPVSSTPDWKAIVQRLFGQLGNDSVHQFLNDESAINSLANALRQRNQRPTLLVLDDVWQESGSILLNKLLESPMPSCCKILITSRFTFPTFGCTYLMDLLSDKDSMTLFHHLAFPEDKTHDKPDEDLVEKIVSYCKGLPLAIVVVAGSLRRQPEVFWRTTEKKWRSEGRSIYDSNAHLLERLSTSLDVLDDLVKECFFDLGLFLEDQRVPSSTLIDIWAEVHDIDDDDVYVILLELYTRNLASLIVSSGNDVTKLDGCYNELFITQHDLLRELAIHKSSQENIEQRKRVFLRGNELSKYTRSSDTLSAQILSIFAGETISLDSCDVRVPETEVLMLNLLREKFALPPFMGKMNKLKVLIITNHGLHPAELRKFSGMDCISSLRRVKLEKILLPSLDDITFEMKNLQKISFVMCKVGPAFKSCSAHIANVVPNIKEIEIDYCIDLKALPNGLCNMISLKKLSVTNCHNLLSLPNKIGELASLEALRLSSCTGLVELPESVAELSKLGFLDIFDCISLVDLPQKIGKLYGLKKLNMRGCTAFLGELPRTITDLRQLKEVICDEETADLWIRVQGNFNLLKIKVPEKNVNLNWRQV